MKEIATRILQWVRGTRTALLGSRGNSVKNLPGKKYPSKRRILPPGVYTIGGKLPPMNTSMNDLASNARTKGLPNAIDPMVIQLGAGKIKFIWKDNSGVGNAHDQDRATLNIYCRSMKQRHMIITPVTRGQGEVTIDLSNLKHKTVNTWISFQSALRGDFSELAFTGKLFLT